MAWTEQDYQEIVARLKRESQGVGDVPTAESLDGITSLPAYQPAEGQDMPRIVRAPLALLAEPSLEAAKVANEAAALANEKAGAADEAARTANAAASGLQEIIRNADTATVSANSAAESANRAASGADTAAGLANEKAALADTAAANANDTASHPTYIGTDHYVYKWNKATGAYDKTDIYCKGDAFTVKKVYASISEMNNDTSTEFKEGDFCLINTGDVENPENAQLFVRLANGQWDFLVDMSGAIGFTGKTPQFSMGAVSTLEAGASATATVSEDGTDSDGNPKYKINFAIPRGNPGAPFRPVGQFNTPELLKQSIPDGSNVEGMIAVGTKVPYDYYAWLNGDWVNQGKIEGVTEAPTDGKTYARRSGDWVESVEKKDVPAIIDEKSRFGYVMKEYTIDASALDENTWYPVTMNLGMNDGSNTRIEVVIELNSNVPSWSNHALGFTTKKIWEVQGESWGAGWSDRKIFSSFYDFTDVDPVRGIGQMHNSSNEYVYVRGGGKYYFRTSRNIVPVLVTTSFSANNETITSTTTPPAEIVRNVALTEDIDKSNLYKRYGIGWYIGDTKCVLLLWEAEPYANDTSVDAYYGTIIGCIYSGGKANLGYPEGNLLLQFSFTGSDVKDYSTNNGICIFSPNNLNASIVKCTYNGKKYLALKLEGGQYNIDEFVGFVDRTPVFKWVDYEYYDGSIMNQEIHDSIEKAFANNTLASTRYVDNKEASFYQSVWQGSVYNEDSVNVGKFTGSYFVDVLFLDTSNSYYFSASVIMKKSSERVGFRNIGTARYSNEQIIVTTNSENIKIENINVINFH